MGSFEVPDWLTGHFLKSCLESNKENFENITIVGHTAEPAVPAGNNYSSLIIRCNICYKKGDCQELYYISLIIKAPMTDSIFCGIYTKEQLYYKFIGETYKLCNHDIVPKHYTSPNPLCVVLEDLAALNFKMVNRHDLLDFEHCKLYVKASAKLHALSIAVYKTNPELVKSVGVNNKDVTEQSNKVYRSVMMTGFQCMAAYLEDKPDYKDYCDFMRTASENDSFFNVYREMDKMERPIRSLTQRDPWCTNMMFKYNRRGEAVEIKLLDFQGMRFSSPAREFVTFMWLSANPEVKEDQFDNLCQLYCGSLNSNLEELGCPERLSLDDLKEEITVHSPQALCCICVYFPLCIADEVGDLSDFNSGYSPCVPVKDRTVYKLYMGSTFNKYYPRILDQAERQGIFSYVKEKMNQLKVPK